MTDPCKTATWYRPFQQAEEVMWMRLTNEVDHVTSVHLVDPIQRVCRDGIWWIVDAGMWFEVKS